MNAGYSGKPLHQKLGYKAGMRIYAAHAPDNYLDLLGDDPPDIRVLKRPGKHMDVIHAFYTEAKRLEQGLQRHRLTIAQDGMIWVSWPKKASAVTSDITEDVVRAHALPLGLVDVKVCAVDDVWSGLKLVIRKSERLARR
ncbi:MAG TPA: DUF3052 domain-containing protein [Gammaproteobacteria bacterium]|jgi:hypothetical protein|nr:DUF3052 domain-containing protein [Gammaproteobacteria bacterium]